ncbi:MAG: caspase family protein [Cyanobacteria bacterium P01_F01_bin.3]
MSPSSFSRSLAVIIGIDKYSKGISPLQTAVNDAKALAQLLHLEHGYDVKLLVDESATLEKLRDLLENALPEEITEDDRVLFYFAGHGVAADSGDGPTGYLIPQDADRTQRETYLSMQRLHDTLMALPCRHLLTVLDCCFSGAFRWSSTRDITLAPDVIYQERFERFIRDPAWQVLTSSGYDQLAIDSLENNRGTVDSSQHSPFSEALLAAIRGKADIFSENAPGNVTGDGVITATELYLYLRHCVENSANKVQKRQTPGLWPLRKHGKGEYIFLVPGHPLSLPAAPDLILENNPYRGLEPFEEKHAQLFFGRETLIENLQDFACTHQLTVVVGVSGSGKSSLVKAGIIPRLRKSRHQQWHILPVIRPGGSPLTALAEACISLKHDSFSGEPSADEHVSIGKLIAAFHRSSEQLATMIGVWSSLNPETRLLLVVDQFEELITACRDPKERKQFLDVLQALLTKSLPQLTVIFTLRSDFESQFVSAALSLNWLRSRFVISPMTQKELREAIERPAQERVLYFYPPGLVDDLINEVVQMPGALPLLSFTLSELYIKYLGHQGDTRSLTRTDYEALGGVVGSLTQRAEKEYAQLVEKDEGYRKTIRNVMLRMIATSGGESARKRVSLDELNYPKLENKNANAVIQTFVAARLLVIGQDAMGKPYVEPAHDALVRGWTRLQQWKSENLESLTLQQLLTPVAQSWHYQTGTQRAGLLWNTNPRLNILKGLLKSSDSWLNQIETEFVRCSIRKRRVNGSVRTSFFFVFSLSVLLGSIISSEWARLNKIKSNTQVATNLLNKNDSLTALNSAVSATHYLENTRQSVVGTLHSAIQGALHPAMWAGDQLAATATLHQVLTQIREKISLEEHSDRINDVAFSPVCTGGEQFVASASRDGTVRLRSRDGNSLQVLDHATGVNSLSFSPGCQFLVTASGANVTTWSLSGIRQTTWATPGRVADVSVSHTSWGGLTIATLSVDTSNGKGQVQLWQPDGTALGKGFEREAHEFNQLDFSRDGRKLAVGGTRSLYVWEIESDQIDSIESAHDDLIRGVAFSADDELLASASNDGSIKLWDRNGELFGKVDNAHSELANDSNKSGTVNDLSFGEGDRTLVSVGQDEAVIIWQLPTNTRTKSRVLESSIAAEPPNGLRDNSPANPSANPPASPLYTEPLAPELLPFETPPNNPFSTETSPITPPAETEFSAPKTALALKKLEVLKGHTEEVNSISFNPVKQEIVTVASDNTLKIWNLDSTTKTALVDIQQQPSLRSFLTAAAEKTVLLQDGGRVSLWHLNPSDRSEDPERLNFLNLAPGEQFIELSLSPDGKMLATARQRSSNAPVSLELWNLEDGRLLMTLSDPDSISIADVLALTFSPDGTKLAVATSDNTIQLWTSEGEFITSIDGYADSERVLSFSPNGKSLAFLASVEASETIGIWSAQRAQLQRLEGHNGKVNSIRFSQNTRKIATTSDDQTVKLWDYKGTLLSTFAGHSDRVQDAVFYPNGQILASISDATNEQSDVEGEIMLWTVQGSDISTLTLSESMGYVGMYFTDDGNMLVSSHRDYGDYSGKMDKNQLMHWNLDRAHLLDIGFEWLNEQLGEKHFNKSPRGL